jgi:phosphoribosylformylglycinamidine synthase
MAQFVGCLEGMGEACRALDFPIVSGNVSLYNESKATGGGSAILPTPAIGGVGLLPDWEKSATIAFKAEGEAIFVVGERPGNLGQSLWLSECHGRREGSPPIVNLSDERNVGELLRSLIQSGAVTAVHDVSDGGLLIALTEMALAGNIGFSLENELTASSAFAEDQGVYVITASKPDAVTHALGWSFPSYSRIGHTGGQSVEGPNISIPLADLRAAHEGFFPALMQGEL